jgi:hypothetical protein
MVERDRKILGWTNMSKLQNIAARAPQIVADLEDAADRLDSRLTALQAKGHTAFGKWNDHLAEQESAIAVAEDAINKLSNGGPPLEGSSPPSPPTAAVPFRQPGAGGGAA